MNEAQQAYVALLAALWVLAYRERWPMVWLTANCIANLAICYAMDVGTFAKDDARAWMMLADLGAGAALIMRPGLSRIIACGYAVSVPAYAFGNAIGISDFTTFAVVYATAFAQLGVVAIGTGRGGGRRFASRLADDPVSMGASARHGGLAARVKSGDVVSRGNRVQG